jgi:dTMP kinase
MKIIPVEGLDKSGKKTQVELLKEGLEKEGYKVVASEFHQYDSPTGQIIKAYLKGEIELHSLALECIIAADKYNMIHTFNQWRHEGYDVLLLDRYVLSTLAYALSKLNAPPSEWLFNLIEHLPEPDFHVYLDIHPELSMKRKGKHGDNDRYESDFSFLERVRDYYMTVFNRLNEEEPGSAVIVDADQPVEEIAEHILEEVLEYLRQAEPSEPLH